MINNFDRPLSENEHRSLSRWELMKRRFYRNNLAVTSIFIIAFLYIVMVFFPGFFSTNNFQHRFSDYIYSAPQWPKFVDDEGNMYLRPFVYGVKSKLNRETFTWESEIDTDVKYPLYFFTAGYSYKLGGIFETDIHLIGIREKDKPFFLLGTDRLGKDLFSSIINGGRVSLSVGLIGVFFTILLGTLLGTISGYFGGVLDNFIQRIVELLRSFPAIPLWAALAAALPAEWTSIQTFFAITIILALKNWTGLARQVRGKVLAFREEEYIMAAKAAGAPVWYIIFYHMIPNIISHIIVITTLSIPGMILAETSLSFLGLGIQPPMTSWGVLLKEAQHIDVVLNHQWLLIPGLFVIFSVLTFNFLGDGLRDAADPFSS